MAEISKKFLSEVKKLYCEEFLSVRQIGEKLGVSTDAVFYFMRRNGIARRDKNETKRLQFQKARPSFKLRKITSQYLEKLKIMGVMLYWGEGSKWDGEVIVDFANSDKDMIVLFLKFLREVCGIEEEKLRVSSYFYANQDAEKNIAYWSDITKIRKDKFTKPYVRKDFNKEKTSKMPHGLIHVRYGDKKLLILIKDWIKEYRSF